MKRPMTTAELFDKIYSILKEKNKMLDGILNGAATAQSLRIKISI